MKRNSRHGDAFDVRIIDHKDYPFFQEYEGRYLRDGVERNWRNDDLQSFTPLRFMPPELMGYKGARRWSIPTCSRPATSSSCCPATWPAKRSCAALRQRKGISDGNYARA